MLIFDQLRRDDIRLRIISIGVLVGVVILLAGLWWVQIVSSRRYQENLKNQSFRSVRVPALRGKILDRDGETLAENRPRFDVNLYLEDLRDQFTFEYKNSVRPEFLRAHPQSRVTTGIRNLLVSEARYRVASNLTAQITAKLQEPQILDQKRFIQHYTQRPYIPFPILQNLTPRQVATFAEQLTGMEGVEMEIQPLRTYPNGSTAAHLLGWIQRHDKPDDDEEIDCKYYLPDFVGRAGIEQDFDSALRGKAGVKSLLVNNVGYRQREETILWQEPGKNLFLTIDLEIQKVAEKALAGAQADTRGAVVVMDVRNGDVLAMASAPTFDPNVFPNGISTEEWQKLNDDKYRHMFNRATYGAYPPGSTLKILTAIACFEAGVLNPREIFHVDVDPQNPPKGCIFVERRKIRDTANTGDYDFIKAFYKSSNSYFIHYGLKAGFRKLVEVGDRFHLGEPTGILPGEEVSGNYPSAKDAWTIGRVANLCIGQEVTTTPLQIATMTAAIANGGKLFWPRLVRDLQPADVGLVEENNSFRPGSLRADLHLNPRMMEWLHKAMVEDVENPEGTGKEALVKGFRVAGKTGTAQITKGNLVTDHITWFVAFAPFENPKYAIAVMVASGTSGGGTCAPVAQKIFEVIAKMEQRGSGTGFHPVSRKQETHGLEAR
ncbi:MAG: penicillin-binding transpeptidase domain-containing protein, partial [Verrucomicrobiota bacterium]